MKTVFGSQTVSDYSITGINLKTYGVDSIDEFLCVPGLNSIVVSGQDSSKNYLYSVVKGQLIKDEENRIHTV